MTRQFEAKKAVPLNTHVRIALVGAAGSGKTYSALRLATGIGGKIVLIDTENRRAAKYAKRFDFEQIDFQPPFNPASYGDAIDSAIKAGATTVIIDSMSHEHEGEGGILEMAESFLEKKCGDDWKKRDQMKFASWIAPKRERTQLIVNKIQRLPINIILCFRAKEVTKPVRNAQGKIEPLKEWDMIGGDEYRYEMDVTAFLPSGSEGVPDWTNSMKRINDADGTLKQFLLRAGQLTEEVGRQIRDMNTVSLTLPSKTNPRPITPETQTGATTMTTPTPTATEETPEQKIRRMAGDIGRAFTACKELADIEQVATEWADELDTVKGASQAAYDHVMKVKTDKIAAMEAK